MTSKIRIELNLYASTQRIDGPAWHPAVLSAVSGKRMVWYNVVKHTHIEAHAFAAQAVESVREYAQATVSGWNLQESDSPASKSPASKTGLLT